MTTENLPKINQLLTGWTIQRFISPTRAEGVFAIVAEKDGQTKTVEVYATELGWWLDDPLPPGQHEWTTWDFTKQGGVKVSICNECGVDKNSKRGKLPCKGKSGL